MPEDSSTHNKENINTIPTNGIQICGIPTPPKRQRNTKSISDSKGVAALHSSVEYAERHVLTGHRESELHSELAESAPIRPSVLRARLRVL